MRLPVALLVALLGAAAQVGDAQVKGDKAVPSIDSEENVGGGDWGDFGWKVGTSHANVVRLGKKWQLSGVGDSVKNDDWLRLFDVGNRGFFGGFAAGKIWAKSLIGTSVQIGNKWKLQELQNGAAEKGWLRLTSSSTNKYFGGLAVGKLKTKHITTADTVTGTIKVGNDFMLAPKVGDPQWLHFTNPKTKEAHSKGGLEVGALKAGNIRASGAAQAQTLKLGKKFSLHGAGDALKDDDYLRLMSHDNKRLFGGFAASKLWGQHLYVQSAATFKGTAIFQQKTVFEGKVIFKQPTVMTSLMNSATQVGNIILSNKDAATQATDSLHLYQSDGKTYGSLKMKKLTAGTASANVITLGKKWRLSGIGDKFHDDDWLRLLDKSNKQYYGGLAVKKRWTTLSSWGRNGACQALGIRSEMMTGCD